MEVAFIFSYLDFESIKPKPKSKSKQLEQFMESIEYEHWMGIRFFVFAFEAKWSEVKWRWNGNERKYRSVTNKNHASLSILHFITFYSFFFFVVQFEPLCFFLTLIPIQSFFLTRFWFIFIFIWSKLLH